MTINKLTLHPTEADLEAEIHCALKVAFPWLKPELFKHQTRFSFKFGRSTIEIDGASVSKAEARSDILIYHGEKPLAVLELKRSGVALTEDDIAQGLSYAHMLHPQPPLVVITNGKDMRLLATHTGENWEPTNPSEEELAKLVMAVGKTADAGMQHAVEVLLGPTSTVWAAAIRVSTALVINDLAGEWNDSLLPFVSGFLIPRHATERIYAELKGSKRIVILKGPPLVGKSCVLRELCSKATEADDLVILFIEADGNAGSGVIQSLANLLADTLGWSVSPQDIRTWLRRLSRGTGPTLVLAVDGVGIVHDDVRRDIEELTSDDFGAKLRMVLAIDDTIVERLVLNETGRKKTRIGRRAVQISVGPLDNTEFREALRYLWNDHRITIMGGSDTAAEFRIPWILRTLVASVVTNPKYKMGYDAIIPPLLGLDLVLYVRERFNDDHDLRRQYQELAQAVLQDSKDHKRPISLILESMSAFVIRNKTLRSSMERADVLSLVQRGYLKPRMHLSGEFIFVPRLPELLLSEIAVLLGKDLSQRIIQDVKKAGDWLVARTAELPLGDLIGAQAIFDSFSTTGHLPLGLISRLIAVRPHRKSVRPGTRAALHIPSAGMVDLLFKKDGSILAKMGDHEMTIERDEDDSGNAIYADVESWLILSHMSRYPLLAQSSEDGRIVGRIDPAILMEVGTCQMLLRRPSGDIETNSIMTHDFPDYGSMVCHKSGIVEPITLAIFQFLSREGSESTEWIEEAIERKSFPLLMRIDIALDQLAVINDADRAKWAKNMITEHIKPAFKNFPPLH